MQEDQDGLVPDHARRLHLRRDGGDPDRGADRRAGLLVREHGHGHCLVCLLSAVYLLFDILAGTRA